MTIARRSFTTLVGTACLLATAGIAWAAAPDAPPPAVSVQDFLDTPLSRLTPILQEDAGEAPGEREEGVIRGRYGWGRGLGEESPAGGPGGGEAFDPYAERAMGGEKKEFEDDFEDYREPVDTVFPGLEESWATRMRIGIEFGAFLPFGAKEDAYSTGELGGAFFGFKLPPLIPGILVTNEVRLLGGYTSSSDQESGHDVSALVLLFRNDVLFHILPGGDDFNIFFFAGVGLGFESLSAERSGGGSESDSAFWFVIDGGLGGWVRISGPLDLVLRLEFDIPPLSDNTSLFLVGEAGIQITF